MRVKNVKLQIIGRTEALKQFAEKLSAARRGISTEKHEAISFPTVNTFRKVLTQKRLELLRTIKQKEPGSVYELAKVVDRDIKSVNTDLSILEELGLVSLEETQEERIRIKPHVLFDKIKVEIEI